MTFSLQFLPEVEDDASNGFRWYENKSPGLGEEFLRIFYACMNNVNRNPLSYPKVYGEFRRCLLRRFPYAAYFVVRKNQIVVSGLFHCARDPNYVGKLVQDRERQMKSEE